ncbi:unnamed protein product [Caretta caretta]
MQLLELIFSFTSIKINRWNLMQWHGAAGVERREALTAARSVAGRENLASKYRRTSRETKGQE